MPRRRQRRILVSRRGSAPVSTLQAMARKTSRLMARSTAFPSRWFVSISGALPINHDALSKSHHLRYVLRLTLVCRSTETSPQADRAARIRERARRTLSSTSSLSSLSVSSGTEDDNKEHVMSARHHNWLMDAQAAAEVRVI